MIGQGRVGQGIKGGWNLVQSRGLCFQLSEEHPQGQDVIHCWEGSHCDHELHIWVLGFMHTEPLDLKVTQENTKSTQQNKRYPTGSKTVGTLSVRGVLYDRWGARSLRQQEQTVEHVLTCSIKLCMSVKGAFRGHPFRVRVRRMVFILSRAILCIYKYRTGSCKCQSI